MGQGIFRRSGYTFFCMNGYINFLPLDRFGKCEDQRYCQQAQKAFDDLYFNKELTLLNGCGKYAIGVDPCQISNSRGKS